MTQPPGDYGALLRMVEERYDGLSDRLRRVARHLFDHPGDLAFETLTVIASRSGVQPSSIVRFAQALGFDAATSMQRVVRAGLLEANPALSGRPIDDSVASRTDTASDVLADGSSDRLSAAVEDGRTALADMGRAVSRRRMSEAVALLSAAETVFVVGSGPSLPVATYLFQALLQARRRAVILDGIAGSTQAGLETLRETDVVVAVELSPRRGGAGAIIEAAGRARCPIVVIGDPGGTKGSPGATVTLAVKEPGGDGPPTFIASMVLTQALAISVMDDDPPR